MDIAEFVGEYMRTAKENSRKPTKTDIAQAFVEAEDFELESAGAERRTDEEAEARSTAVELDLDYYLNPGEVRK